MSYLVIFLMHSHERANSGGSLPNYFHKQGANHPCFRGVVPIGTHLSIMDGHKYGCGLYYISEAPIVYSFGSFNKQDFEESMLLIRPDSQIFVYELDPTHMVPDHQRLPGVKYTNKGLG
jgi:hypothetical protein